MDKAEEQIIKRDIEEEMRTAYTSHTENVQLQLETF